MLSLTHMNTTNYPSKNSKISITSNIQLNIILRPHWRKETVLKGNQSRITTTIKDIVDPLLHQEWRLTPFSISPRSIKLTKLREETFRVGKVHQKEKIVSWEWSKSGKLLAKEGSERSGEWSTKDQESHTLSNKCPKLCINYLIQSHSKKISSKCHELKSSACWPIKFLLG